MRPSVDFPEPDPPTQPRISPRLMSRLTSLTALVLATARRNTAPRLTMKVLDRWRALIRVPELIGVSPDRRDDSGRDAHAQGCAAGEALRDSAQRRCRSAGRS